MRRGARTTVLAVVLLAGAACSDDGAAPVDPPRTTTPPGPTVEADGVTATRTWVGPEGVSDDVVAVGDTVLALASTSPGQADLLLRSPDGGLTWAEPAEAFTTGSRVGGNEGTVADSLPRLHAVDDLVLAVRPVNPEGGPRVVHEVLASRDVGATWEPLDLPAPAGRSGLVDDVAQHDGTIVVVGSLQDDAASGAGGPWGAAGSTPIEAHLDAYEPAAWVSTDGGATFSAADGLGDGTPGAQRAQEVLWTGDRFVARGTTTSTQVSQGVCCPLEQAETSWASADGATWVSLTGLSDDEGLVDSTWDPWRATEDGAVVIGSPGAEITLPAGATTWERGEYLPPWTADLLTLDDGTLVATWVEDSACDCIIAHAGAVGPAGISAEDQPELAFDDCEDTSVRGETGISAPFVAGDAVAALAWCNDVGRHVGAIASSTDGGATWTTTRLTALAPEASADVAVPDPYRGTVVVAVDGGAVALLPGAPGSDLEVEDVGMTEPGPLVAVRITAP